jgi:glycosyltransferase involved in cell wall biosynthesis
MSPALTVFFPCYNDGGTIASLVLVAARTTRELGMESEIIVVDDGSTDSAPGILAELGSRVPELRVVRHDRNRGYGAALRSGFQHARGDLVFYTDGDAQYDPRELRKLLDALTPDVDMVNGWKIARNDPLHRVVIGKIYHWTVKLAFGLQLRDTDCDFRLIRKKALDKISLQSDTGVICVELIKKLQDSGARFSEVPVTHLQRSYGRSQFFAFRRLLRVGIALLKLWWSLVLRPHGSEGEATVQGAGEQRGQSHAG